MQERNLCRRPALFGHCRDQLILPFSKDPSSTESKGSVKEATDVQRKRPTLKRILQEDMPVVRFDFRDDVIFVTDLAFDRLTMRQSSSDASIINSLSAKASFSYAGSRCRLDGRPVCVLFKRTGSGLALSKQQSLVVYTIVLMASFIVRR